MKGAGAIITALNIAYDEEETRGFVRLNLLALGITAAGVALAILAVVSIAAMSNLEALLPEVPDAVLIVGRLVSYLIMGAVGAAVAATLYRYGPNRDAAKWRWLTPGSLLATVAWLLFTIAFGIYVANFGSYNATYGSLGAAIVLLTWLYLSAYILLLGAEFNCELERQTARDTTKGPERPIGTRGAYAADTVASGPEIPADTPARQDVSDKPQPPPHPPGPGGSPLRDYAVARIASHAQRAGGMEKVGVLPAIIATTGLAMLRRKGGAATGITLLALGAAMSWRARER